MKFDPPTPEQKRLYERLIPGMRRFWLALAPDLYTWAGWAAIIGALEFGRARVSGGHAIGLLITETALAIATWGYFITRLAANQPTTWQAEIPNWKPIVSFLGTVAIMAAGWWLGIVFGLIEAAV